MAHLHRWALAFLGSGFGGSLVNAAESAPRQPASLPNRIASLQGPSAGAQREVPWCGGSWSSAARDDIFPAWRDAARSPTARLGTAHAEFSTFGGMTDGVTSGHLVSCWAFFGDRLGARTNPAPIR
jgi:hypothetical protein